MNETKTTEASMSLPRLMGIALGAAVVAMAIQWFSGDSAPKAAGTSRTQIQAKDGQRAQLNVTYDHRTRGAKDAQAQLVVYGDFASPFAATSGAVVDRLLAEYGTKLSVSYRHFQNPENHTSTGSAVAAEAAAKLGKFEAFRSLAYALSLVSCRCASQTRITPTVTHATHTRVPSLAPKPHCLRA